MSKKKKSTKPTAESLIQDRLNELTQKRIDVANYVNSIGADSVRAKAYQRRVFAQIEREERELRNQLLTLPKED